MIARNHRQALADTPQPRALPELSSLEHPQTPEAGQRLQAARTVDRQWREVQSTRLQAGIDAVCERELHMRRVCPAVAYLLANLLLMTLLGTLGDLAGGSAASRPILGALLAALLLLPLLAGIPWATLRLRRALLQRQASRLGIEVALPEQLRARPRAIRRRGRPQPPTPHAVESLLAKRRAQTAERGAPRTGRRW